MGREPYTHGAPFVCLIFLSRKLLNFLMLGGFTASSFSFFFPRFRLAGAKVLVHFLPDFWSTSCYASQLQHFSPLRELGFVAIAVFPEELKGGYHVHLLNFFLLLWVVQKLLFFPGNSHFFLFSGIILVTLRRTFSSRSVFPCVEAKVKLCTLSQVEHLLWTPSWASPCPWTWG